MEISQKQIESSAPKPVMKEFIELNGGKFWHFLKVCSLICLAFLSLFFSLSYFFNETLPENPSLIVLASLILGFGMPLLLFVAAYPVWILEKRASQRGFQKTPLDQLENIGFSDFILNCGSKWKLTRVAKAVQVDGFTVIATPISYGVIFIAQVEEVEFGNDDESLRFLETFWAHKIFPGTEEAPHRFYSWGSLKSLTLNKLKKDLDTFIALLKKENIQPNNSECGYFLPLKTFFHRMLKEEWTAEKELDLPRQKPFFTNTFSNRHSQNPTSEYLGLESKRKATARKSPIKEFFELNGRKMGTYLKIFSLLLAFFFFILAKIGLAGESSIGGYLHVCLIFMLGFSLVALLLFSQYYQIWVLHRRGIKKSACDQLESIGFSEFFIDQDKKWKFTTIGKAAQIDGFTVICQGDGGAVSFTVLTQSLMLSDRYEYYRLLIACQRKRVELFPLAGEPPCKFYLPKELESITVDELKTELEAFVAFLKKENFQPAKVYGE